MTTAAREKSLMEIADLLLDTRRTGSVLPDLPVELQPVSVEEAYVVQDIMAKAYGEIGGWKIGAPTADATPIFAPMPTAWIHHSGVLLGQESRYRGLEAEVAFRLGSDLPARSAPYSREEIFEAIEGCYPAIEVLESAFADPTKATRLSMMADMQMHGGFIYGSPYAGWRDIDFSAEHVTLAVDGSVRVERTGSNTSGDLLRLLPWLANEGSARTGGLKAGQWITTGSWTGNEQCQAGCSVEANFSHIGRVSLQFA